MLHLTLAAALAIGTPLIAALSTAQIASVFVQATDLTGASIALPEFVFTVITNATHALVSLESSSPPASVGWMGTGVGTAMGNADFLITWPNAGSFAAASSPWTLSHRQSQGEIEPTIASTEASTATANFYVLLPELSSTNDDPFTSVAYLRPLAGPPSSSAFTTISRGRTNFIFASSTIKPTEAAETATLTQHDQAHARTSLDLSIPVLLDSTGASNSSAGGSSPTGGTSGGLVAATLKRSSRDKNLIAHATVGSLGFLLFSPLAILIARFLRRFTWFPAHASLNLLASILVILAFGLGYAQVNGQHFFDAHTRLGLALLILIILQVSLGALAHRIPSPAPSPSARLPTLSHKPVVRLGHIVLGLLVPILGFVQIGLGFDEWEKYSDAGEEVPKGARVVAWVLVGIWGASYVGGWAREFMGGNRARGVQGEKVEEK